jgi:hypothetical protein
MVRNETLKKSRSPPLEVPLRVGYPAASAWGSGVTTPEAPRKPLTRVLVRVGPAAAPAMSAEGLTVRIIKLRFRLDVPSVSGPFRLHGIFFALAFEA